jgi:DNA gyrase inhibitor GyrI
LAADDASVSIVRTHQVSNGVTVSRLRSGEFAVAVHDGDLRAIVDVTADELRDFAARLARLAA